MKNFKIFLIIILIFSSKLIFSQNHELQIEWEKFFDKSLNKIPKFMVSTNDNGCIIGGKSIIPNTPKAGFWVTKINYLGLVEWDKNFEGTGIKIVNSLAQTYDGGYILCGEIDNYKSEQEDIWIAKLNFRGIKEWEKIFFLENSNKAYSIKQTNDNGYVLCGESYVNDRVGKNFLIMRLNSKGEVLWNKNYGFTGTDIAYSIIQTNDGGFAVCGEKEESNPDDTDFWILKLNKRGEIEWTKTYGGHYQDKAKFIFKTPDEGCAVAGYCEDIKTKKADFWVLKLDKKGKAEWEKTFGGFGYDVAKYIYMTKDKGFVICGDTYSPIKYNTNFWIIKLDQEGIDEWDKEFLGAGENKALFIVQADNCDYFVLCKKEVENGLDEYWLLRISETWEIIDTLVGELYYSFPDVVKERERIFFPIDRHIYSYFKKPPMYNKPIDTLSTPFSILDPISHYYIRYGYPLFNPLTGIYHSRYDRKYVQGLLPRFIPGRKVRIYTYFSELLDKYETNEFEQSFMPRLSLSEPRSSITGGYQQRLFTKKPIQSPRRSRIFSEIEYTLDTKTLIPMIFLWIIVILIIVVKIIPKSH